MTRDLDLIAFDRPTFQEMDVEAMRLNRIRVLGVVTGRNEGYSGRYRNTRLLIAAGAARVEITASPTSPLGTAPLGSYVDVAATLTGMVDLSHGVYFGKNARLLSASDPRADEVRLFAASSVATT